MIVLIYDNIRANAIVILLFKQILKGCINCEEIKSLIRLLLIKPEIRGNNYGRLCACCTGTL